MRPTLALTRSIVEADAGAEVGVELGRPVGHLDDEPLRAVLAGGLEHQRDRVVAGDQVRVHAHPQHPQAAGEVVLPQRVLPVGVAVTAEDVVDEHVEPALLGADPLDERRHGVGVLVVDHQADAGPGPGDPVAGVLDGLGPVDLGTPGGPAAATGGVDVAAGTGQLDGDGTAGPAGGAGDESDGLIGHASIRAAATDARLDRSRRLSGPSAGARTSARTRSRRRRPP
jgi:hypothetical protein